jgi:hypothetical protein
MGKRRNKTKITSVGLRTTNARKEHGFGNQLWVWGGRIESWGCSGSRVGIRRGTGKI